MGERVSAGTVADTGIMVKAAAGSGVESAPAAAS
jgi:hypothetical protein